MKKILLTASFLMVVAVTFVSAQEQQGQPVQEGYVKDLMEVNFFGGGGFPSGDIKNFGVSLGAGAGRSFGLEAGFFATNNLVAGLNFSFTKFQIEDKAKAQGLHHKLYSPNLYLKYYFSGQSDFVPYIKAHGGLEFAKFATLIDNTTPKKYREISYDPALAYGVGAGLFYFTTDFSGIFAEINFHHANSDGSRTTYQRPELTFNSNINVIDVHAGVRILISPGQ